ncbi:MAG: threonylcarbamoyl-AMP synthase [Alphaproteobacteria bacterium]|nr:threonylcarbamoyl-AMP synthase [Alphaproteobacteria bacterium]
MSCTIHHPDAKSIAAAAERLRAGKLVALPTETVYGLAADATNDTATASIYAMKGRPSFNPLIVHLAHADDAAKYAVVTPLARALMAAFWPGPLTLVLERSADCPLSLLVSAGLNTVALRVPSHPVAHELLKTSGLPLAAPSANRSGKISPTTAAHVQSEFADEDLLVLDGGACIVGLESTVIDARGTTPVLLRPGGITDEAITTVCGVPPLSPEITEGVFHSPGLLASHYAPEKPIRLNAQDIAEDEFFIGFALDAAGAELNLSPSGDLVEAAANLFAYLRQADAGDKKTIAVATIPEIGLGIAINDRLRRAAAEK